MILDDIYVVLLSIIDLPLPHDFDNALISRDFVLLFLENWLIDILLLFSSIMLCSVSQKQFFVDTWI